MLPLDRARVITGMVKLRFAIAISFCSKHRLVRLYGPKQDHPHNSQGQVEAIAVVVFRIHLFSSSRSVTADVTKGSADLLVSRGYEATTERKKR